MTSGFGTYRFRGIAFVAYGRAILLLAVIALASGCTFKFQGNPRMQSSAFASGQPRRVAVMPFRNATQLPDAGEIARSSFFNALLTRHYQAVDCDVVDKGLAQIGLDYAKDPLKVDPTIFKDKIPADAALYGEVLQFSKSYWSLYSHLKLRARVALFDVATGEEIFSDEAQILNRRLSPPISLPGILFSSLETFWHLREAQKYETFRELAHRMVAEMPESVPMVAAGTRFIKAICVTVPRQILVTGDVVQVAVTATPGERGYCEIVSLQRRIPLTESAQGTYTGHYSIQAGDNAEYCIVQVCLFDGNDTPLAALNSKGGFAVDTAPPQSPKIVSYHTTHDSLILALSEPEDEDFSEFNIFRSANGEEMQWIGKTDAAVFEDDNIQPLMHYDYVVEASDRVGNKSRSREAFEVALPMRGPVTVDEDFTRDVTLTEFGSPYYFERVTRVEPHVTVRIHPGVEMYFEEDAGLSIAGQLVAVGEADEPITFSGARGWKGLYCSGEGAQNRLSIKNASFTMADNAIIVENGGADLENVEFVRNQRGVAIAGNADVTLKESVIRKNGCGINLSGGTLSVEGCDFAGNKIGIKIFPDRVIVGNEKKQKISLRWTTQEGSAR